MDKKNSINVFLGIGSSQEFSGKNSKEILQEACKKISKLGKNFRVSSFIQSEPWGKIAKNIFTNAVCRIEVSKKEYPKYSEEKFLDILQDIEKQFGRVRDENTLHWADRTLDIDILFWGTQKISRPRLTIPHPYIWKRDFVFEPLREILLEGEEKFLTIDQSNKRIKS